MSLRRISLFPRIRIHYILLFFLLVMLGCFGFALRHSIRNQLDAWKLLPQPERLTELYFTHPDQLPVAYVPGQALPISFVLHDLEYRTMVYQYQVVEQSDTATTPIVLASGSVRLQQNQYHTTQTTIIPVDAGTRAQIIIRVPAVNEQIAYWVNKE